MEEGGKWKTEKKRIKVEMEATGNCRLELTGKRAHMAAAAAAECGTRRRPGARRIYGECGRARGTGGKAREAGVCAREKKGGGKQEKKRKREGGQTLRQCGSAADGDYRWTRENRARRIQNFGQKTDIQLELGWDLKLAW